MRRRAGSLSIRRRLHLFLTRGDHFIVLAGHLYLPQSGFFSRWLPEQDHSNLGPEFSVFTRVRLGPRHRKLTNRDTAILISGFGRFGNMVIQVWNTVLVAKRLGIERVLYWNNARLSSREIELIPGVHLTRADSLGNERTAPPTHLIRTRAFSVARAPEGLSFQEIASLRNSLSAAIFSDRLPATSLGTEVLTIHLRSGDVFWNEPHKDYGQPPFAFYELVVKSKKWEKVILVSEDQENPCFALVTDLCDRLNLETHVTGRSLDEALDAIANASTLVMSRGTFVASILWLAPANRHIFTFGSDNLPPFPLENTSITHVIDAKGTYESQVLNGNWRNNGEQRGLMVSYPTSSLRVVDSASTL